MTQTAAAEAFGYVANLNIEIELPNKGVLSQLIQNDEHVRVTAFGFAADEELSTHSAPTPAILYFLEGEADVQLGDETRAAQAGTFVYMPPMLPHALNAKTAVKMLLVQVKAR